MKPQGDSSSRGQKDLFIEKRKAAWRHAGGPGNCGPLGEVGNWVLQSFLYCPRVQKDVSWEEVSP
jgi:hypothetical protein